MRVVGEERFNIGIPGSAPVARLDHHIETLPDIVKKPQDKGPVDQLGVLLLFHLLRFAVLFV